MIASQDVEALADFEALLNTLAGDMMGRGSDMTIFYLKYVKAAAAAQTLDQIFGGGTVASTSESGRSGGLIGDLASAALGGGGGIMGALLGMGGNGTETIAPTGSIRIIPYEWHNALIVQANSIDTDTIDKLLEVLDQQEGPEEVMAVPRAHLVPVINTLAEEVAEVVQQVYRDRMVTGSGERGRQPSPEEFVRMLRGGGRGSRGSSRSSSDEAQKLSIGVDTRSNSVIVAAPEPLFQEVRQLILDIDAAAIGSNNETMRVVTLRKASPEAVQKALQSMMGDSVQVGSSGSSQRGSSRGGRPPTSGQPSMDARRAMFFEMMRRSRGFGGPGGDGRGGPPGGSRGGPGGGRPGGPPGGGRGR